jgi:hypothetical protein
VTETPSKNQPSDPGLAASVNEVAARFGKKILSDDDLLIYACGCIARTYTFEEKGYLQAP